MLGWIGVSTLIADLVVREIRARSTDLSSSSSQDASRTIDDVTYEVMLADETIERVDDADAYQLEGPLTTFFRTTPGRTVVDCWSTRLASYRTADIRRIRVSPAD